MDTRNITLTMPADLVRRARVLAAERDTSVSALVVELLQQHVEEATEEDSLWAIEEAAMASGIGMRVGEITWTRDELHER
jgi:post-segregation antitoxin (ccd killing protein)